MVWLTWLVTFAAAAAFYASGVIVFTREPFNLNIYIMVFLAVLLVSILRGWQTRHKEFTVFATIFAIKFTLGHIIWSNSGGYHESIVGHMILHTVLAFAMISLTTSRVGAVVALLFCLDVVWGVLGLIGVFPERPWPTFTGFYYGDAIAYTGHLAMIVFGLSCGDGGPRIRNWLYQLRGYYENRDRLDIGGGALDYNRNRGRSDFRVRSDRNESRKSPGWD